MYRGANVGGPVGEHLHLHRFRQTFGELRQHLANAVGGVDDVGSRLALDVHHDGPLLVGPRPQPAVFSALLDAGDIAETDRRPVLIGDNQAAIILRRLHLIVSGKRHRPGRAVEAAFRGINVGAGDSGAHGFAGQAEGGDGLGVKLHPHRRALAAGKGHQTDAGDLGDFLRHPGLHHILHLGHRNGGRGDGEGHDRRIRRVHLAVDRRVGQIARQQVGGGVNRRLHFLLGDVQRQGQLELQRDYRGATGALRRHLFEAGHLAELALQRGGDGGGHHVRAGARIEGNYLDGRVINLR